MSIYDKPVERLTTADIDALLADSAVENVRLEFKRDDPGKDEWLKKLSAFANTYGGYLVLGAEADGKDGRLRALPGIDPVSGIKQRLVQWCHDGTSPPVQAFVSDPIPTSENPAKVWYVVFIEESAEAPHFINSRKGAYVRTNEFSQRFEPRLATYDELVHLQNRREETVRRKKALLERAELRFDHLVTAEYSKHPGTTGSIGATLHLFVTPRFPSAALVSQRQLLAIAQTVQVQWRQVGFPCDRHFLTQHESVLTLHPASGFSMLETSVWGHLFLANEVEYSYGEASKTKVSGIHLNSFMGHLLVFLEYGKILVGRLGFTGTLDASVRLRRVQGKPWLYFVWNAPETGPASPLDDDVSFSLEVDSSRLMLDRDGVATELARAILYALNWPQAADDDATIKRFIQYGYEYNFWKQSS